MPAAGAFHHATLPSEAARPGQATRNCQRGGSVGTGSGRQVTSPRLSRRASGMTPQNPQTRRACHSSPDRDQDNEQGRGGGLRSGYRMRLFTITMPPGPRMAPANNGQPLPPRLAAGSEMNRPSKVRSATAKAVRHSVQERRRRTDRR